jgi:putative hydrolase of the HAD superfamily
LFQSILLLFLQTPLREKLLNKSKKELIPELYNYKHISFDLWLTLIRSNPEFKIKRDLLFKDFFEINNPIEEVSTTIRKYDLLTNTINEKAGKNFDTFEIYLLILDALSIDINTIAIEQLSVFYFLAEELFFKYKPLLLNEEIPALLQDLKQEGKTINILSNTAFIKGSSLREILRYYDLFDCFSFQIYSDEVGYSKPNQEIYQLTFNEIEKIKPLSKHEIIHVGDNIISDYNGAKKFGFAAHLIIN